MLIKKMLRDIRGNIASYLACIAIVAIGLMAYTSMSQVKDNLYISRDTFYKDFNYAQGFAIVKSMTLSDVEKLKRIEGIDQVQGRLTKEVRVYMPESDENVFLKLISISETKEKKLNDIDILKGRLPKGKENEILLAEAFLKAHDLKLGDEITLIIEGKKVPLNISGFGQSPEYIYTMKSAQEFLPDPKTYEVAYLSNAKMQQLFNSGNAVNEVAFSFEKGYEFDDVEDELRIMLKKYFLKMLVGREDHMSHTMLTEELNQLEKSAKSMPLIFLMVAGIIIYIMLKRLVDSQRCQIGILKAFGYTKKEVLIHYLSYGVFIGLVGGISGGLFGTLISGEMTNMYKEIYKLPNLVNVFSYKYFFGGIVLSVVFCLLATFQGTKSVLKLKPSEAMIPPPPESGRKTLIERIPGVLSMFNVQGRMAIRNVFRSKLRSLFTLIGIMFSFSLISMMFSMNGLIDIMLMDQFNKIERQDVKINFSSPRDSVSIVSELNSKDGVKHVEPVLEIPMEGFFKHRKKGIIALGVKKNALLYNIYNENGKLIDVSDKGVIFSQNVANNLGVKRGDVVKFETAFAKKSPFYVGVVDIIPQYIGVNIYFNFDTLNDILEQGNMATSALILIDDSAVDKLKEDLNDSKYVKAFDVREKTIEKYETLLGSFSYMMYIMLLMAIFTGFAICYNSGIISLAERKRELASLRVLGMRPKEVLQVVSIEQWIIGMGGMIVGIPVTIYLNYSMSSGLSSDLFTMPMFTEPKIFIQGFFATSISIIVSVIWISTKIKKLDLVEVLKERA